MSIKSYTNLFHLFTYSLWTFRFLDNKGIGTTG